MLHWCGLDEGVRAAVGSSRVCRRREGAIVITVDERVHMSELYELLAANVEARGVPVLEPIPSASPRVLPFCAGNAEVSPSLTIAARRSAW